MTIEQELGSLHGIVSVEVDVDTKRVAVKLISPPTKTGIEKVLMDIGCPPESK